MQYTARRLVMVALACAGSLLIPACGKEEGAAQAPATATAPTPPPQVASAEQSPWTPEALEELLAPIALYPDPVLAQVLATAANPQEVLDAGNWLVQNPQVTGKELETAATSAGFTPPMIALVQFPAVVDMMCMQMDWTTELGTAYQADTPGVLSAVQRLRAQAVEMGNLKSSEQMKVSTETAGGQQVVIVQPAQPQVVYVPQYDPQAVYTQPAAAAPVAAATTTTTQTTTTQETGHSTGTLITTGLLAFGAGMLVNEAFSDDDDDDWDYPNWGYGYGGPPYYPPPYRPAYGGGYRPSYGYNRPANYQHGFNNNNIYVNNSNNYYGNRFNSSKQSNYKNQTRSPITSARGGNRPELQQLNASSRPVAKRDANWKGQGTYQGAANRAGATNRQGAAAGNAGRDAPAVTRNVPKPVAGAGARDRGRAQAAAKPAARPQAQAQARTQAKPQLSQQAKPQARPASKQGGALQNSRSSGKTERAASQRGRASMSGGSRQGSSGRQGGGGQQRNRRN